MILRFGVENYRSLADYTELSFVSTPRRDEPSWRLPSSHVKHGVLPVVGLWGANASGKSNLVQALLTLVQHVARSFVNLRPGQSIPWTPFSLDEDGPPTTLDIDFEVDGVRYHYGFKHDARAFLEEWLLAFPGSRQRVLFRREQDEDWYFGPSLKGPRSSIAEKTRPNSLFLSAAAQHNHPQLGPLYEALTGGVHEAQSIVGQGRRSLFHLDSPLLRPNNHEAVASLLAAADIGVTDWRPVEDPELVGKMNQFLARMVELTPDFSEQLSEDSRQLREIRLVHGSWELPSSFESAGTNVLLTRLENVLLALERGSLLVVDELDTSLHPDIASTLVSLFTTEETNPRGAQLLFATHDRDLLAHLRTDEVVLVDKKKGGSTTLAAASDYRGVRTRDDLRRLHAEGRLRGVPVLGDLRRAVLSFRGGEE